MRVVVLDFYDATPGLIEKVIKQILIKKRRRGAPVFASKLRRKGWIIRKLSDFLKQKIV